MEEIYNPVYNEVKMSVKQHSKHIQPGDTFVSLPSADPYIPEALKREAHKIALTDSESIGAYFNHIYNSPSTQCKVIGITGTNGKTTVTQLVYQALNKLGKPAAVLGTLNSELTTPDTATIYQHLQASVAAQNPYFVMEVSSHGIDQNRIAGIQFEITALTNITHDHIDYHGSFENYKATKETFIAMGKTAIYPADYASTPPPQNTHFCGVFNQENLKLAKTILLKCGCNESEVNATLSALKPPPGRFERITEIKSPHVFIDFAHCPDALTRILIESREIANKKKGLLRVVFGCGGHRDRQKRPLMTQIAKKWADQIIITTDNPRTEPVEQILSDMLKNLDIANTPTVIIEPDRRLAVRRALKEAGPNDVILLAGKGPETYQYIGNQKIPYNDKETALEWAKERPL